MIEPNRKITYYTHIINPEERVAKTITYKRYHKRNPVKGIKYNTRPFITKSLAATCQRLFPEIKQYRYNMIELSRSGELEPPLTKEDLADYDRLLNHMQRIIEYVEKGGNMKMKRYYENGKFEKDLSEELAAQITEVS